jgi:hypothetical protein
MERISLFSRSTVQPVNSTRIDNARQRAEALFKPKSPPKARCANETANKMAHEPRVLSISALTPEQAPTTPAQPTPMDLDRRHFPRVRALAKYGMTTRQIAETYGVPASEIRRILRKA